MNVEPRPVRCLTLTCLCVWVLVSAASAQSQDNAEPKLVQGLIQFSPMYSAFDGVHEFQVTPSVPLAAASGDDAIEPSSLKWELDSAYLKVSEFPDLPAAVRFTTKRAGSTVVKITATTRSGARVRDEASVIITQVDAAQWDAGYERYNVGKPTTWSKGPGSPEQSGPCDLPGELALPTTSACSSCHAPTTSTPLGIQYTPTQTARYSDKELIRLFTEGQLPTDRNGYDTAVIKAQPQAKCAFMAFHTWYMTDVEKRGVVGQLRAVVPSANEAIDKTRLTTP